MFRQFKFNVMIGIDGLNLWVLKLFFIHSNFLVLLKVHGDYPMNEEFGTLPKKKKKPQQHYVWFSGPTIGNYKGCTWQVSWGESCSLHTRLSTQPVHYNLWKEFPSRTGPPGPCSYASVHSWSKCLYLEVFLLGNHDDIFLHCASIAPHPSPCPSTLSLSVRL